MRFDSGTSEYPLLIPQSRLRWAYPIVAASFLHLVQSWIARTVLVAYRPSALQGTRRRPGIILVNNLFLAISPTLPYVILKSASSDSDSDGWQTRHAIQIPPQLQSTAPPSFGLDLPEKLSRVGRDYNSPTSRVLELRARCIARGRRRRRRRIKTNPPR
jgi:hypothetical protein